MPENAHQRGAGQFRLILQIGQHIRHGTHAEGYLLIRDAYSRGGDAASGHAELTSTHVDLRRFDLSIRRKAATARVTNSSVSNSTIGGRLDALPQGLKFRTELYVLAQMVRPFIPVFADVAFDLVGCQQVNHCRCEITMRVWKIEGKSLTSWIKGRLDAASRRQHALEHEGCTDDLGSLRPMGRSSPSTTCVSFASAVIGTWPKVTPQSSSYSVWRARAKSS